MEWLEAVVHTTTFGSDLVSDEMMALGAAGTEIVDRADVPDPRQPGVYWELYDPAMIDAMPDDVLVKAWFERGERNGKRSRPCAHIWSSCARREAPTWAPRAWS